MRLVLAACVVGAALSGCATSSSDITAAYVSPIAYDSHTCKQLREDGAQLSLEASRAIGEQDSRARRDKVATAVGAVVFLPSLLFIQGDGAGAAEVSRLKGEMRAIEAASVAKNCGISFRSA